MSPPGQSKSKPIRDQLASLESDVLTRMRELEPVVREYQELEQIAERLGLLGAENGRVSGRLAAGERQRQLLDLIRARPGVTVREAADDLAVDPTSLYRIVRRLVEAGEIEKRSTALHPR